MPKTWEKYVAEEHIEFPIKWKLSKKDKVFAVGSCFANQIKDSLNKANFSTLPRWGDEAWPSKVHDFSKEIPVWGSYDERLHHQYFTPQSIFQEIRVAAGELNYSEHLWEGSILYKDRRTTIYQDPYKRRVYTDSKSAALECRSILLKQFREGLELADAIVITLGLVEDFKTSDGFYINSFPAEITNRSILKDIIFTPSSFSTNLDSVRLSIKYLINKFNIKKIFLTTSPIPLKRTFKKDDVVIANTYSKAILRAVCGEIVDQFHEVQYVPSFELVMNARDSFDADKRHVSQNYVDYIMKRFLVEYIEQ